MARAVSVVTILPIVFRLLHYGSGIGQLRNCPYLEQISPNPELNRHVICSSIHVRFNETGCLMSDYFKAGSTSEVREDSCGEVEFKYHDKFNDLRSQCYCVIDQQEPTRYETLHCLFKAMEAIYDFMHLECVDEAIAHLIELGLTTTAPSTNMTTTTTITRLTETNTSTSSDNTTATAPTETIRTSATIPSATSSIPSRSITTIAAIPYTNTTTGASTPIESIATAPSPTTVTTTAASMGTSLEATTAIPTPNTTKTSTAFTEVTTTATIVSSTTTLKDERSMISTTASTTETATTISEPTIAFSIQATPPMTFTATSLLYVDTTTTSLSATAATISTDTVSTDASQKETDSTTVKKSSSIGSITKSTMFLEEVLLFWSCILNRVA
uniref:Conserved secreted protein n=1 Tax=Haemonchus contortus TaxID=6289 RepID=A0A7I4XRN7_HAECO